MLTEHLFSQVSLSQRQKNVFEEYANRHIMRKEMLRRVEKCVVDTRGYDGYNLGMG